MSSHQCEGASTHQQLGWLFNKFLVLITKKTKHQCYALLAPSFLCEVSPLAGAWFPSKRSSNAESYFMAWRRYVEFQYHFTHMQIQDWGQSIRPGWVHCELVTLPQHDGQRKCFRKKKKIPAKAWWFTLGQAGPLRYYYIYGNWVFTPQRNMASDCRLLHITDSIECKIDNHDNGDVKTQWNLLTIR